MVLRPDKDHAVHRGEGEAMKTDRKVICDIVSRMLDNPDASGIYHTSTCFTELEHYVEKVRMEAIGWMHAAACVAMDDEIDPRTLNVPDLIASARKDLDR